MLFSFLREKKNETFSRQFLTADKIQGTTKNKYTLNTREFFCGFRVEKSNKN